MHTATHKQAYKMKESTKQNAQDDPKTHKTKDTPSTHMANIPNSNEANVTDSRKLTQIDLDELAPEATMSTQRLIDIQESIAKMVQLYKTSEQKQLKKQTLQKNTDQALSDLQEERNNQDDKIGNVAKYLTLFTAITKDNFTATHDCTNKLERQLWKVEEEPQSCRSVRRTQTPVPIHRRSNRWQETSIVWKATSPS